MGKITYRQEVNDISPYSQINKAFRHVHGGSAAALLSTLLYKFEYHEQNEKLESITLKNGDTIKYFYISKLDISLDSGISISTLEKNVDTNPIKKLEDLKMIQRIKNIKSNKSDRFSINQNAIKKEVVKAKSIFDEDMAMLNKLPREHKRAFLKALKGKQDRYKVYEKYQDYTEFEVLEYVDNAVIGDESSHIGENSAPIEAVNSADEGRTKNTTKNSQEYYERITNSCSSNQDQIIELNDKEIKFEEMAKEKEITNEILKNIITEYINGNCLEWHVHTILKNYIPDEQGSHWKMSPEDKEYIIENLKSDDLGYVNASLDYIETNVQRMVNGKRKMRFGSMLAGIREKVLEAGVGYVGRRLTVKEYQQELANTPNEVSFEFEDNL